MANSEYWRNRDLKWVKKLDKERPITKPCFCIRQDRDCKKCKEWDTDKHHCKGARE